jgi:segregation and condensation protein A
MEYNFVINDFEGPLDLLLHLIKVSKMDIYNIKINEITKQYIDFINKMEEMNLSVASEYLVMASELTLIKSKMLLPNNKEDELEEDPKENLINRLVEYQKYKNMIDSFKKLEQKRKDIYTKEPININEICENYIKNDGEVTIEDLTKALENFLKRKEVQKPLTTKITKKELLVSDRTKEIKNILKNKKKVSFFDLFTIKTKEYVVVTFLSILEMAKLGEIKISQEDNFNNIVVSI